MPCITCRTIRTNAAQERQRVACEGAQTVAALATSRTAVHMTSRFRDVEKNAEANFSQQQRGVLSEITSESGHSRVSDTLWFMKLQQWCGETLAKKRYSPVKEVNFNIIIITMRVNPKIFNNLKQSRDEKCNDEMQNACTQEIYVQKQELRMPVLHQKLFV